MSQAGPYPSWDQLLEWRLKVVALEAALEIAMRYVPDWASKEAKFKAEVKALQGADLLINILRDDDEA